jgi:AAA domain (dynein-related subfamily)
MSSDNGTSTIEDAAAVLQSVTIRIELRKKLIRHIQEEPAIEHMMSIIREVSTRKWTVEWVRPQSENSEPFLANGASNGPHEVSAFIELTGPNTVRERDERLIELKRAAQGSKNQKRNWFIHRVDGKEWEAPTLKEQFERANEEREGMVSYAEVAFPTDEIVNFAFEGIYGANDQVARVVSAMRASIKSEFRFRTHMILLGQPGCGKSYTLELARKMFFDQDAILVIDGTAMTSAGVIDILEHLETLPRFIFIEEIDKADPNAVQVLLGLMDRHAEIRKSTFRHNIQRECRVCVFATANSLEKVKRMQEGALYSRFGSQTVTYDRPTPEMLRQILNREMDDNYVQLCQKPTMSKDGLKKIRDCGKCAECQTRKAWIERTLKWTDEWQSKLDADTKDPRFVIDFLMTGQEALMGNEYYRQIENTSVRKDELKEWN